MRATKRPKATIDPSEDDFKALGGEIMGRSPDARSITVFDARWAACFGVMPVVCVKCWQLIIATAESNNQTLADAFPHHLLWGLMLLKQDASQTVLANMVQTDEKNFRKWSKLFVYELSYLVDRVILWENRLVDDQGYDCLVSVDCTDCKVERIAGAEKAFQSYKFRGPGLRYEIAICIMTGWIVWLMGPFPAGDWPDVEIFRFALKDMLGRNERVEADDGYVGEDPTTAKVPRRKVHNQDPKILAVRCRVRRRHETGNARFKQFKILADKFGYDVEFHAPCFRAVVVLVQLSIENGERLFSVADDYHSIAPGGNT